MGQKVVMGQDIRYNRQNSNFDLATSYDLGGRKLESLPGTPNGCEDSASSKAQQYLGGRKLREQQDALVDRWR
jgi:hypothetical protein